MRPRLVLLSSLLGLITTANGQVSLPNPPFLPPSASNGAQRSNNTQQSPNPQWSSLLGNLLYFYEAQRSGKLPLTKRVSWRNSSSENDGSDENLDLSGGYYDAGDYIKATFPLSATLMSICWGAIDFGKGYDIANQTPYLDDMLRWGLDWMIKAHPSNNTLYVLVGDTDLDNAYWGGDQNIPPSRPSYQVNDTNPGTDAVAGASAAFSACSLLYSNHTFGSPFFSPASLQNTSYAQTLLSHAESLYNFAVHATGGRRKYQESVPAIADAYASSSYGDELTLAALLLSWATNSTDLFEEAQNYYKQFGLSGEDGVFNWDSKTPGLAILFAQIANSTNLGGNFTQWQGEAERYFDAMIDQRGRGKMTKNGLLYYDGDSDSASLNPALNAAMLITRFVPIASTLDKQSAYTKFAKTQVDYALGKNPMSVPYIVGVHPNSPQNPHSAMASGGSDVNKIDISPEKEAYVLYGAVVGGPDKADRFWDIRSDWPETEVALDYNAPLLTLAAMHALDDRNDPYFTTLEVGQYGKVRPKGLPCDPAFPAGCRQPLSKGGKVALGVVFAVTGVIILALLGWWLLSLRKYGGVADTGGSNGKPST